MVKWPTQLAKPITLQPKTKLPVCQQIRDQRLSLHNHYLGIRISLTLCNQAATLARVRNNQRRCRARKRDYVAELEKKIKDLQGAIQKNSEDHRNSMQRLQAENRQLQELLVSGGGLDERDTIGRLEVDENSQVWQNNSDITATNVSLRKDVESSNLLELPNGEVVSCLH